jgi:hypothetical protein
MSIMSTSSGVEPRRGLMAFLVSLVSLLIVCLGTVIVITRKGRDAGNVDAFLNLFGLSRTSDNAAMVLVLLLEEEDDAFFIIAGLEGARP